MCWLQRNISSVLHASIGENDLQLFQQNILCSQKRREARQTLQSKYFCLLLLISLSPTRVSWHPSWEINITYKIKRTTKNMHRRRNDSSVNGITPIVWEFSYPNPWNSYMNSAFDLLILPSSPSLKLCSSNMEIKKKVGFIPPRKKSESNASLVWRW